MTKEEILLIWHGSKDEEALHEFHTFCGKAGANYCFLDYVEPLIPTAVKSLVEQEVKKIRFIPYFLFNGIHVRHDIPSIIEEQKRMFPDVEFILEEHIGINTYVINTIMDRFDPEESGAIILVACGSREERAKREIRNLSYRVSEQVPGIIVEPCFIANAEPTLENTITLLQARGITNISIVPVMLFAGKLLKRAERICRQYGYRLEKHLGLHDNMIQLVQKRSTHSPNRFLSTFAE